MGAIEATNSQPDGRLLDGQGAGPAVPRLILGAQLRRMREARGISREAAGETIRASHSKISRLELGRTGFKLRDVEDLLTLYGGAEEGERATLLTLAKQANTPAWWQSYADVVPSWLQTYLGLEQAADVIRGYEVQFIPGLLQTADYARAVILLSHPDASEAEIERRVQLRMRRQRILHQTHVPHLWAVIDEAALRRPIGSVATMRAELEHLLTVSELPHVTVQVMPFRSGGHVAAGGPITILRLPGGELPDVVYLEQLTSALYPDRPSEIEHYRHIMNRLVVEAEQPAASRATLRRILRET
jgi:transcriptional regulator with XRE-family HTH domain